MSDAERYELAPGYSVSRIINGCWQLTADHGAGPTAEKDILRVFAERVDNGLTTFDCADIYAGTEDLLGKFRRNLSVPERIQIHTKYVPDRSALRTLTDDKIDAAIDRSLSRLGVDRLDLVQFHWWDYSVPGVDKLVERLSALQTKGKIRLLGATNLDTQHLRELSENGADILCLQTQYSLLDRRPERHMVELHRQRGIRLLAYGVLSGGFLSDKYHGQPAPRDMNRSLQKYRLIIDEIGGWSVLQKLLDVLSNVARKHQSSIAAVAARWALQQASIAAIILGIGHGTRIDDHLAIARLELDDEDNCRIADHLAQQKVPQGDMYDLERDPSGPHAKIIRTELNAERLQ